MIIIEKASASDSDDILAILEPFVKSGVVLPRPKKDLLKVIDDFFVAKYNGATVGCAAFKDYASGLFEIRSLVVESSMNNKGVGKKLISFIVDYLLNNKKVKTIFALTMRPEVFEKVGFELGIKTRFPEKIWDDCSKCKKQDRCDEIAVVYSVDPNKSNNIES